MIKLSEPSLCESEINAAVDVLRSGNWRQGERVAEFEDAFAASVGAEYAVACSSGTAALHLAYLATITGKTDHVPEVLVPAFTFVSTVSMIPLAWGRPVFVDIDPDTWTVDVEDIERKITLKTRAVVGVHIFGNPCKIQPILDLAKKYNLSVIWDVAQAQGAIYAEHSIGSFPDVTTYSFYPTKNMFVGGEGGMVVTNDPRIDRDCRLRREHGFHGGDKEAQAIGYNYRMRDLEGAVGLEQLRGRFNYHIATRERNARYLQSKISSIPGLTYQKENGIHAWNQFCITVDPDVYGCTRDELRGRLLMAGVQTNVFYPRGVHQHPAFTRFMAQHLFR